MVNRITANDLTGAQREQNAFNAGQAQIDRDFQERMSNTAYQRSVQDMRSAGVNPALAIGNGSASTPSGSTAVGSGDGLGASMSELLSLLMIRPQIELMRAQASALGKQGDASILNAEANKESAAASTRNASSKEREVDISALLADNTISVGRSVIELNRSHMDEIAQSIRESESRVSLQNMEYLAKELDYQFNTETFETNKALLIQQLAYRAVEMSEMRSTIALNNELKNNAAKSGEMLDADLVGAKLTAEWKDQNPRLVKVLEASNLGTAVIGNIFRGGFSIGRSFSRSSVDVSSQSTNHTYTHKQ